MAMIKSDELILTHDSAPTRRRRWSYALGFLALISCPCHVPLLALALSGTVAGALLATHFDAVLMIFTGAFLLSVCAAIWVLRGKGTITNSGVSIHEEVSGERCTAHGGTRAGDRAIGGFRDN
jgi:mercuric ion transport protein